MKYSKRGVLAVIGIVCLLILFNIFYITETSYYDLGPRTGSILIEDIDNVQITLTWEGGQFIEGERAGSWSGDLYPECLKWIGSFNGGIFVKDWAEISNTCDYEIQIEITG